MFLGDILKTCPDEVFAVISVKDGKFKIRSTKNRANTFYGLDSYFENKNKLNNPIIIVTESPHIDEFDIGDVYDWKTKELVQARPVNGISGQNILQYLCEILTPSVHLSDGTYPVIIINAITKQCSEGKDTLIARTRNFIKLWLYRR